MVALPRPAMPALAARGLTEVTVRSAETCEGMVAMGNKRPAVGGFVVGARTHAVSDAAGANTERQARARAVRGGPAPPLCQTHVARTPRSCPARCLSAQEVAGQPPRTGIARVARRRCGRWAGRSPGLLGRPLRLLRLATSGLGRKQCSR